MTAVSTTPCAIHLLDSKSLRGRLPELVQYASRAEAAALSYHPSWLTVLEKGLGQAPYCLEAVDDDGATRGFLPVMFLRSLLFGRFAVSLPYLNVGGVLADGPDVSRSLIDAAIALADRLDVKYLELRHECAVEHPKLATREGLKVHMRLPLPASAGELWEGFRPQVRNQIRKGQKHELSVAWGGRELLPEFYRVFCANMRDLGTPVFPSSLFRELLSQFPSQAELAVLRLGGDAVAAALLVHGRGVTEVPSASALRRYNSTCANMVMYWHLLVRAVERGHTLFDFGRSTPDSGTYRFKKQWGALPAQAQWQYYVRSGSPADLRPENPRLRRLVQVWQHLPVALTRLIGPTVVRGIP